MPNQSSSYRDFPLLGKLVILRPFIDSNLTSQYIDWLNDPAVVRYSNQRFCVHTLQTCKAYLNSFENSNNMFLAIYKDSSFVGTMTAYISKGHQTADMGIMIGDRHCWGKGIGKDAWITLMQYLLNRLHIRKVTGGTLRCNTAMVNIMVKAGMQPDGVRAHQELVDGNPVDILHYAKFRNN